jgi:SAM-dependent methyltransferase
VSDDKPHSQEYFGEWRDFWWNPDFLQLMAQRWQLGSVSNVLDVGCGVGHWSRTLLRLLPSNVQLTGIDREAVSIQQARDQTPDSRCTFQVGDAQHLPCADNTFDMVTCQTVLIHVADVPAVLQDMVRVLKPGGLLAVAEPNNVASRLVETSVSSSDSIEAKLARVRFGLVCEQGKAALGQGHNSIGDMLPGLFLEAGLSNVQVYLSDKATPFLRPYDTPDQKVNLQQTLEWIDQEFYYFDRDDTHKYFLAGGGDAAEFEALWEQARHDWQRFRSAALSGTLHSAGGDILYAISGRKSKP